MKQDNVQGSNCQVHGCLAVAKCHVEQPADTGNRLLVKSFPVVLQVINVPL